MTKDTISGKLQKSVQEALLEAIDWDFCENILDPIMDYLKACDEDGSTNEDSPFGFYDTDDRGLRLVYTIMEDSVVIFEAATVPFVTAFTRQYPDCKQSQYGLICGLEKALEQIREDFTKRFGVECSADAIAASFAKQPQAKIDPTTHQFVDTDE